MTQLVALFSSDFQLGMFHHSYIIFDVLIISSVMMLSM